LYTGVQAGGALIDELLGLKDYNKAQTVLDRLKENYAQEYAKTQTYKAEHPYESAVAAGLGLAAGAKGLLPAYQCQQGEITSFKQAVKEGAIGGASRSIIRYFRACD
jgi:hypothetical protein